MDVIRVFSYGGGVQSNAVLVLQAAGGLSEPYDVFVFANVGADSENPVTLRYVDEIARPYAEQHGIPFVEVSRTKTDGVPETLLEFMYRKQRVIPIPVYMSSGAPGNRICTTVSKIEVVDRWLSKQGYCRVVIGLGISLDEYQRARDLNWYKQNGVEKRREYPLIDLRLRRQDCRAIVAKAGLSVPPKSSCWFCPFHRPSEWIELRRTRPDLFQRAVELECMLNERRAMLGRDRAYLHSSLTPLDQAVGLQLPLFHGEEMDMCESGYCMV